MHNEKSEILFSAKFGNHPDSRNLWKAKPRDEHENKADKSI